MAGGQLPWSQSPDLFGCEVCEADGHFLRMFLIPQITYTELQRKTVLLQYSYKNNFKICDIICVYRFIYK